MHLLIRLYLLIISPHENEYHSPKLSGSPIFSDLTQANLDLHQKLAEFSPLGDGVPVFNEDLPCGRALEVAIEGNRRRHSVFLQHHALFDGGI